MVGQREEGRQKLQEREGITIRTRVNRGGERRFKKATATGSNRAVASERGKKRGLLHGTAFMEQKGKKKRT